MNSFGNAFNVEIFGESHGKCVGVTLDGVPSGVQLTPDDFYHDIDRRRPCSVGTTSRKESDQPIILAGVLDGYTTGSPITIIFENANVRSVDYAKFDGHYRPSHVDFVATNKYGPHVDLRGGGAFSGRLTLPLVAAGTVAKKLLHPSEISSRILSIGGLPYGEHELLLKEVMKDGDSLGGLIECTVDNLPVGLGEPFFDSVESIISHVVFSIPAVKGVEFGSGFKSATMRGSEHNDPIISSCGKTSSNNAGGIVGGITNGNQLLLRVAVKPTASISKVQMTWNDKTSSIEPLRATGRHDSCIALRAPVVIESAVAIALAQFSLPTRSENKYVCQTTLE